MTEFMKYIRSLNYRRHMHVSLLFVEVKHQIVANYNLARYSFRRFLALCFQWKIEIMRTHAKANI